MKRNYNFWISKLNKFAEPYQLKISPIMLILTIRNLS